MAFGHKFPRGVQAKGRARPKKEGMNKLEADYAAHLDRRKLIGQIAWRSEHEAFKLRLADNTFFTTDFVIMLPDGSLEIHDTKGRKDKPVTKGGQEVGKTESYWCPEHNKVKIKLLAEIFPIAVKIVWKSRTGEWMEESI